MKKSATKPKSLSKRQVLIQYGFNSRHLNQLIQEGFLLLDDKSTERRVFILMDSVEGLLEDEHYIVCRECGAYQSQITTRHLKSCCGLDLAEYQDKYPNATLLSRYCSGNKAKTEAQKQAQSEKLKARFQTPEGAITREKISKASKALMRTSYRKKAAEHLRSLNQDPEQQELLRQITTERWEEGGDLREKVPQWHLDNKERSNYLAAKARSYIKKKSSKLHLTFKDLMISEGLTGFITEFRYGFYHIDEANPDLKLAIEIDGCYWHSCPECGYDGPQETLATDNRKESFLEKRGWTVLRFWGHDIKQNPHKCIEIISSTIGDLT